MKTFNNEECQVLVKAVDGLSRATKIMAEHIEDSFDGETFVHVVEPFRDCKKFADSTIHQLGKIMKRLQK